MKLTPEGEVKKQIVAYLERCGIDSWPVPVGPMITRGGRSANPMRGIPDRLGLLPGGRLLAIEVKAPDWRGKLDQHQAAWRSRLEAGGALYILARSVEDVAKAI